MNRVQGLDEISREFQPVEYKVIPPLKALKRIHVSTLTQEGVIDRGSAHEFGHWYLSLVMRWTTYEYA